MWWWRKRRCPPARLRVDGVSVEPEIVGERSYPSRPGQLWVADIAVGRTDSGYLYLAAVLDCYDRRCVGFSIGPEPEPGLLTRAVRNAVAQGLGPKGGVGLALAQRCAMAGMEVSEGASPSAIDAAVAVSFFSRLRRDLARPWVWRTRSDAAEAVASWIDGVYNRTSVVAPAVETHA